MTIVVTDRQAAPVSDRVAPAPRRTPVTRTRLGLLARLGRSMRISRSRRVLRSLPDYVLKDIGIGRCEIDAIAQQLVDNPEADPRQPPRSLAYRTKENAMSNIANRTKPPQPKIVVPQLSSRPRTEIATRHVIAIAVVVIGVLLVMPILAARQTSFVRDDAPALTETFELMKRARDLPLQEIDGLI